MHDRTHLWVDACTHEACAFYASIAPISGGQKHKNTEIGELFGLKSVSLSN